VRRKETVSESYVLRELGQLKALADPLRQRLLRAFAGEPQTTKQVAHSLKEKPTKLYHHVDTLAAAGLLRLVKTQQKRGTTERYYQAAAKQFSVHRNIFRHLAAHSSRSRKIAPEALFDTAFQNALAEIRHNVPRSATGEGKAALLQGRICVTPDEAIRLRKKIQHLIENCARRKRRRGAQATGNFEILLAIYPVRSRRPRQTHPPRSAKFSNDAKRHR
jgi:DNA-binding transcriptional ArsR family regulator